MNGWNGQGSYNGQYYPSQNGNRQNYQQSPPQQRQYPPYQQTPPSAQHHMNYPQQHFNQYAPQQQYHQPQVYRQPYQQQQQQQQQWAPMQQYHQQQWDLPYHQQQYRPVTHRVPPPPIPMRQTPPQKQQIQQIQQQQQRPTPPESVMPVQPVQSVKKITLNLPPQPRPESHPLPQPQPQPQMKKIKLNMPPQALVTPQKSTAPQIASTPKITVIARPASTYTPNSQSVTDSSPSGTKTEPVSSDPVNVVSASVSRPEPRPTSKSVPKPQPASRSRLQEQALYDLAKQFYTHAHSKRHLIKSTTQLQEYYTLIKLSVLTLSKLIQLKQKASLRLRIKANIRMAEIISSEGIEGESPDQYLSDAVMLCGQSPDLMKLKVQAESGIIQNMINSGRYKQALKCISTFPMADSLVFKYLKFTVQKLLDPIKAHQILIGMMTSADWNIITSEQTRTFIQLTEVSHAFEHGLKPFTPLATIVITDPLSGLHLWKEFLVRLQEMMYRTNLKDEASEFSLSDSFIALQNILYAENKFEAPITLSFPFAPATVEFTVQLRALDIMRYTFMLVFAAGSMNVTYEKRRSLKAVRTIIEESDKQIKSYPEPLLGVKFYQDKVAQLKELKSLASFYTILECTTVDPLSDSTFEKLLGGIEGDRVKSLYATGIHNQVHGRMKQAIDAYRSVIHFMELSQMCKYDDVYIITCLNLYAIAEAGISKFSRAQNLEKVQYYRVLKNEVEERFSKITSATNSAFVDATLISTTLKILKLVFNDQNLTAFDIQEQVDQLLTLQDRLKKFPLYCSILLYLKSFTLNHNSDQKQKTSQAAFNCAKFGYYPLIRYITGVLNAQNATIARNETQAEMQNQKLIKIEKTITEKYSNLFADD